MELVQAWTPGAGSLIPAAAAANPAAITQETIASFTSMVESQFRIGMFNGRWGAARFAVEFLASTCNFVA